MRHPKGLYLIFAVEMWERFSYYGMRALLVLFLTAQLINGGLGFSEKSASLLYGIFTGLVYFTPLIGGYLADNYIGQRKAILWGMIFLIAGQLALTFSNGESMVYILTSFAIAFFAGYEQAGCSMTLFSEKFVDRNVLDFQIPTAWLQSINPLLILLLAPVMSMMWSLLGARGKEPSIPAKMGWGLILLGVGFIFMLGAIFERGGDVDIVPDVQVKASMWWVVAAFFFHTVGELCLSPIGLSMVSKLAPIKLASLFMGVWLASSAIANFMAGYLSSLTERYGCYEMFLFLTCVSIALGVILIAIRKPMIRMGHGKL